MLLFLKGDNSLCCGCNNTGLSFELGPGFSSTSTRDCSVTVRVVTNVRGGKSVLEVSKCINGCLSDVITIRGRFGECVRTDAKELWGVGWTARLLRGRRNLFFFVSKTDNNAHTIAAATTGTQTVTKEPYFHSKVTKMSQLVKHVDKMPSRLQKSNVDLIMLPT